MARVEVVLSWLSPADGHWRGEPVGHGARLTSRTEFLDVPPGAVFDRIGMRVGGEWIVNMTMRDAEKLRTLREQDAFREGVAEGRRRERRRIRKRLRKVAGL